MAYRGIQILRHRALQLRESSTFTAVARPLRHATGEIRGVPRSCRSYFGVKAAAPEFGCKGITSFSSKFQNDLFFTHGNLTMLHQRKSTGLPVPLNVVRYASTQVKAPAQARQMGALQVSMTSPGIVYEPYTPRERISFWKRWFTRAGWKRTKEDVILELKSAYAIAKIRKTGYSKKQFYAEAIELYKQINYLIAHGDKTLLRKAVTEKMYSTLKNDIKMRESMWSKVYWEMVEPVVRIRTLRARLIAVDRNDLNKAFIQLTVEFVTKQKFEAYDSNGKVVAGDKNKEILVCDIWVFEKSMFHQGAYWRLCGKIVL